MLKRGELYKGTQVFSRVVTRFIVTWMDVSVRVSRSHIWLLQDLLTRILESTVSRYNKEEC